jgi:DNA-binding transcriptional LysR family regulator
MRSVYSDRGYSRLITEWDDLEARVGLDPEFEGLVKIASPGSVGLKLYPYLLQLQKRYPKLIIEYRFAPNSEIEKLIAEHKVDFGLMTRLANMADVSLEQVAEEELLLVLPEGHVEPSWDQLLDLGFIDHPDGADHASQLLSVNYSEFQNSGQLKKTGFSNQINLILEPVSLGLGFTVLPSYAVAAFKANEKITICSLQNKVAESLYLGKHASKFTPNRVKTVIAAMKDCIGTLQT